MNTASKQIFLFKDLSGRGVTSKLPLSHLLTVASDLVPTDEELTELTEYLESATIGEEFISSSFKLIAL